MSILGRAIAWVACIVGASMVFAVGAAQSGVTVRSVPTGASLSPPQGALVGPGDPPSLSILFTGDVIGYLDPCG